MTRTIRGVAGPKQDEDLRRNPGIGQSVGTSQGGDVELIEGESTVEGDIDNNADAAGRVKLDKGRTDKWRPGGNRSIGSSSDVHIRRNFSLFRNNKPAESLTLHRLAVDGHAGAGPLTAAAQHLDRFGGQWLSTRGGHPVSVAYRVEAWATGSSGLSACLA